jgi:hypothetical protein
LKQEVEREGVLLFSPREELKKGRTFEQQLLIGEKVSSFFSLFFSRPLFPPSSQLIPY